jgi:Fe-S cluster assembly protein SufD
MGFIVDSTARYVEEFEQTGRHPAEPGWLTHTRRAAIARFAQLGLPTPRDEEWRKTNLAPLMEFNFRMAQRDGAGVTADHLLAYLPTGDAGPRLVFLNGYFAPQLSQVGAPPRGVRLESLARALAETPGDLEPHLTRHASYERHALAAMNTAFFADGAFVYVPRGVVLAQPIHVLFLTTGPGAAVAVHPRTLVVAEAHSQVSIVETYAGLRAGTYLANAVTEIVVGDDAVVDHCKVQREALSAYHLARLQLHQGRGSNATSHSIAAGGLLVRNDVNTVLGGEGAHCTLNGLFLVGGRRHVDNHLRVDHAQPRCDSREFYKGILDGHGRAVFAGRIVVHKDAQKTDAKQTNMNLLLSDDALMDTQPQLEIFADDVKCTHGATIGQLDPEAIFYLRSRGMSEAEARGLLVHAFAHESTQAVRHDAWRAHLEAWIAQRLPVGRLIDEEPA